MEGNPGAMQRNDSGDMLHLQQQQPAGAQEINYALQAEVAGNNQSI